MKLLWISSIAHMERNSCLERYILIAHWFTYQPFVPVCIGCYIHKIDANICCANYLIQNILVQNNVDVHTLLKPSHK